MTQDSGAKKNLKRLVRRVQKRLSEAVGERVSYVGVLNAVREYQDEARQVSVRDQRLMADVLFDMLKPEFDEGETDG